MADRMRTPRCRKEWAGLPGFVLDLTGDATGIGGLIAFAGGGFMVLRMIGEYIITPTSGTVALDDVCITMAIGVVSSDAAAAGAASLPDPADEPEYPWLYWADHNFFFGGTSANPGSEVSARAIKFDIRSMRKLSPRESLVWVVQYVNGAGDPLMHIGVGQSRVLVALP